jgi:hypothetical protein
MTTIPAPQASRTIALVSSDGYKTFTVTALTGGAATSVYTAASSAQRRITELRKLVVTNPTGGAANITVTYYRAASATSFEYYPQTSLASKGRLVFDTLEFPIEPDDELRVTGASGIHVFVSAREYQGNVKS